jgi:oligopeptidase A
MAMDDPMPDGARVSRPDDVGVRLSELQRRFRQNVSEATLAWSKHVEDDASLAGMSAGARTAACDRARAAGLRGSLLGLDAATYEAVLRHADDRALRKELYEAYVTRASDRGPLAGRYDNGPLIDEIVALRHQRSRGLGFANYAEAALHKSMVASAEEADHFLIDLNRKARPRAESELAEVWRFARSQGAPKEFRPWDLPYWCEKLRRQELGDLDEEWRDYLSASDAVGGLVALATRLFGVRFDHVDIRPGSAAVSTFRLYDADGGAMQTLEVHPPAPRLTHAELRCLFREFGRDMQRLFALEAGGAALEADVADLPGRVMERWCYDAPTLASFARHCETGATPPGALVARTEAERRFLAGLTTTARLEVAIFDLRLHRDYVPEGRSSSLRSQVLDALAQVRREVSVLPPPPWNRLPSHCVDIFGGDGAIRCYGPIWEDVLSADLFGAFEEGGSAEETGHRLWRMLTQLGSRPAMTLYAEFRGRRPRLDAWLRRTGLASPDPQPAGAAPSASAPSERG